MTIFNKTSHFKGGSASILALSLMMVSGGAATAQDDAATANITLDEIIVTARRKSENLQSAPVTVSAFNENTLENLGVSNNIDIGRFTPSVVFDNMSSFAGIDTFQAFIRGVGQTDFALNTDPGVGLYIDGVYIARGPGAVTELLDIERIEVLKGPQGTLFGRNAIGGAVNIVTQTPSDEFYAKGRVRYGSFNNIEASGVINAPVAENLNASLAFSADTIDGFQERVPFPSDLAALGSPGGAQTSVPLDQLLTTGTSSGRDPGAKAGGTLRAKLAWDPTDDIDIVISADATTRRDAANPTTLLEVDPNFALGGLFNTCVGIPADVLAGIPPGAGPPCLSDFLATSINGDGSRPDQQFNAQFITDDIDETFATGANFADSDTRGISGEVNWRVNDNLSIKSITAYRELESAFGLDIDSSPLVFDQTTFVLNTEQFSQELQFNVNLADRFDATLGAYYFNEDGNQLDAVAIAGGLIQVGGGFNQGTEAVALFGEGNYKITDNITVLFGGRFTSEEKTLDLNQQNLNTAFSTLGIPSAALPRPEDATFLAPSDPLEETFDNFSFRVGANWQVTDDLYTYATYSQGFKSGGFTTRLTTFFSEALIAAADPNDPNVLRSLTFQEETSDNYEIGFKANFAGNRVRLNAAAFLNQYDDIQIVVQRGVSPSNENIAAAEIKGIEVELEALLTDRVRLNATLGLLDAEYTDIDPAAAPLLVNRFGQQITLDTPLQNTPDFTASAALNVDLTDELIANANISLISEVTNDPFAVENLVQDGYALIGGSLTYRPEDNWSLKLGVDNLADERFIVSGFEAGALPFTVGSFNRGREVYAQVGFEF
jgi:iron complex outermembrane receptor protein